MENVESAQNVEKESHFEILNAEEDANDTFGDLQQFADGLDLENVEVDSDTEQNFEMLLEELDDDETGGDKADGQKPNETEKAGSPRMDLP